MSALLAMQADATTDSFMAKIVVPVGYTFLYALLGIFVFGIAFWTMTKIAPFSIRKEIEHDQNTALGIVIGSVILGLSLIISAAIKG